MSKPQFEVVAIDQLKESPLNPRQRYDQKKIAELAESIKSVGILEPLLVRQNGSGYDVVAGSRRLRAAQLAKISDIPVIVRELTDAQALEIMVIENNQREDVNALEEAEGYRRLLERKYSLEVLAQKIGRSTKYIYDRLKLLQLVPEARKLVLMNKISAGHAILLARLRPEDQKRAIDPDFGGLFEKENSLWDPMDSARSLWKLGRGDPERDFDGVKPRSVRELDGWIAEHVRLEPTESIVVDLFPETAAAVKEAVEERPKRPRMIRITYDNYVQPDAKENLEGRIYTERTWKLADGSKGHSQCDKSVLGVIVLGPRRGEKRVVCVNKDCKPHWAKERAPWRKMRGLSGAPAKGESAEAAAKRRAEEEKKQAAEGRRAREEAAWQKAQPAIVEACAEKIKTAKLAALLEIVTRFYKAWGVDLSEEHWNTAVKHLGAARTIEDLGRSCSFAMLLAELQDYDAFDVFPKRARQIGVDVAAILAAHMPPEKKAEVHTSAKIQPKPRAE